MRACGSKAFDKKELRGDSTKQKDSKVYSISKGVPFPRPPASTGDLSSLTMEELRAMEGEERENVEARITVLRNIHSLLDSAITQLNQYSQAVAATRT